MSSTAKQLFRQGSTNPDEEDQTKRSTLFERRQMMRSNKKEIHDLTRKCRYQMGKRKEPYRELKEQLSEQYQRQNNFDYVQTNLRELEGVHKMVLPSMFDVAH